MSKRNLKYSECEYGEYLPPFKAFTCKNQECKKMFLFFKDRVKVRISYRG